MSLPTRERELKQLLEELGLGVGESLPTRERELKRGRCRSLAGRLPVAPYTGA